MIPRPVLHVVLVLAAALGLGPRAVADDPEALGATGRDDRPRTIDAFLDLDRADRRPVVIAHRGFSGEAPENTLVAVRRAIEIGADMVEVDVTLTSDGHVILLHDETLERTTEGAGRALDTPLEAIRKLDAGSWFAEEFAGEPVPTLEEFLALVKGKILVNLEIKSEAVGDDDLAKPGGGIARKVAEAVAAHGMVDQVIVSSFDPRPLAHLRDLADEEGGEGAVPRLFTASLYAHELPAHQGKRPSEITAAVGASAFHVGARHVDAETIRDAHEHGLPVAVYTVNRKRNLRRLLALGVDAIFTDRPDRMLELLAER